MTLIHCQSGSKSICNVNVPGISPTPILPYSATNIREICCFGNQHFYVFGYSYSGAYEFIDLSKQFLSLKLEIFSFPSVITYVFWLRNKENIYKFYTLI